MPPTTIHVAHVVYRFATGGMENVIVQLINHLPCDQFRHTVIAMTEADPSFVARIARDDVDIIQLHKPPGQPFRLYPAMYRVLRQVKPDVLHTCNLAALELTPVAFLAGIPLRIHAEHGWDVSDPGGSNPRYRLLRRLLKPFVHHFIAVSKPLSDYLHDVIGVPTKRLHLLPNGVDTDQFRPRQANDVLPHDWPFKPEHFVVGTIGRLEPVKNQPLLAAAFVELAKRDASRIENLRLAIIGDGSLKQAVEQMLNSADLAGRAWLPGIRADIPEILRAMDCFVLPSLSEGTSCTLQEAMASGLEIIATAVGGNVDLLENGACGRLVPSNDVKALADAILNLYEGGVSESRRTVVRTSIGKRYGLTQVMQQYSALFSRHACNTK